MTIDDLPDDAPAHLKKQAQELREMRQRYHNVFGTPEGMIVLGDIASTFHLFDPVEPTDIVLNTQRSCALIIMQMAGALNPLYIQLGLGIEPPAKEQ